MINGAVLLLLHVGDEAGMTGCEKTRSGLRTLLNMGNIVGHGLRGDGQTKKKLSGSIMCLWYSGGRWIR